MEAADPWQQEWFSVREAAGILGVSQDTVRDLIAEGRLRAQKFSPRTTRIPRSELFPSEYEEVVVARRPKVGFR